MLKCNHCGWSGARDRLKPLGSLGRLHCPSCHAEYGTYEGIPNPDIGEQGHDSWFFRKSSEPLYYIANRRPVGSCVMWWRVEGHGYTCNLEEAWKVPESKASEICRERPEIDAMYHVEVVEAAARRHVDWQLLRAAEAAEDDENAVIA